MTVITIDELKNRFPSSCGSLSVFDVPAGWHDLFYGLCLGLETTGTKVIEAGSDGGELTVTVIDASKGGVSMVERAMEASLSVCAQCGDHGKLFGPKPLRTLCWGCERWEWLNCGGF